MSYGPWEAERRRRQWIAFSAIALVGLALLAIVIFAGGLAGGEDDAGATAEDDDRGAVVERGGGSVRAGDRQILPSEQGDTVQPPAAGERVDAEAINVVNVVGDEVFWVGSSLRDRLLVYIDVPGGGESPPTVLAGQRASFDGVVRDLPSDGPERFGVTFEEDADLLREQGVYLEIPLASLVLDDD